MSVSGQPKIGSSCSRLCCSIPDSQIYCAGHGSSVKSTITEFSNEGFCSQATTALCAPTLDTASDVKVTIAIQKRVNFGERIAVVGETAVLGRWRPCDGVPLTWSDGDVWSAEVILQPGLHEFKVRLVLYTIYFDQRVCLQCSSVPACWHYFYTGVRSRYQLVECWLPAVHHFKA